MIKTIKRISNKFKRSKVNRASSVLWFLFLGSSLLSGAPIPCASCIEADTVPMRIVEVLVSAPLDSLQAAKTKELDSLKAVHDSLADKLDSLTKKPYIGEDFHFRWYDNTVHHTYWWFITNRFGQRKFLYPTETVTHQ